MRNPRRSIGPSEETALEHLEEYVDTTPDAVSLTRDDAATYLMEQEMTPADARDCIERLLQKGFLYEVNDELRIPPRL